MRIFLLQHGLTDLHTHFYSETLGWIDVLRRRNLAHRIFVHQDADATIVEGCGAELVFPHVSGARTTKVPATDKLNSFLRFSEGCAAFADDLTADDVVFVAFATERELFGTACWLATVPKTRRLRIVI